jgi:hypothetical protein
MSSAAAWANTVTLTLWRKGEPDRFGGFDYSAPEHVLCTYKIGGSQEYLDSTGTKFLPDVVYYTEMKSLSGEFIAHPKHGDKLALGKFTGEPTPESSDIRMITIYDAQMFGESEQPDLMLGV